MAPVESELRTVARKIQTEFGVTVATIAVDLTDPDAAEHVYETVENLGLSVQVLVNNAGVGQRGKFWEIPLEKDLEMIRLNVEAVIRMTKLFLRPMVARGQGVILNTAPVAGF